MKVLGDGVYEVLLCWVPPVTLVRKKSEVWARVPGAEHAEADTPTIGLDKPCCVVSVYQTQDSSLTGCILDMRGRPA